jgi:hypothetical protein
MICLPKFQNSGDKGLKVSFRIKDLKSQKDLIEKESPNSERFRQACATALTLRRLKLLPKASPSFRVFCAAALCKVRAH